MTRLRLYVLRTFVRYYLSAFHGNRADVAVWAVSACRIIVRVVELVRPAVVPGRGGGALAGYAYV